MRFGLTVKRSVQARFNTESSYVRAAATAKRPAAIIPSAPQDAMEALDGAQAGAKPLFVALVLVIACLFDASDILCSAQNRTAMARPPTDGEAEPQADTANADEIQIDDD
jgi:hypothetical protein